MAGRVGRMTHGAGAGQGGEAVEGGWALGGLLGGTRAAPAAGLLAAGLALGIAGDALLRAPGPFGLNVSLWVAAIVVAAVVLQRRAGAGMEGWRLAWLVVAGVSAAGLAWRDSPALKLLALGCVTVGFALAAYRAGGAWVRRAGLVQYARAWGTGALHAWTAGTLVLADAARSRRPSDRDRKGPPRRVMAVVRGLLIATPLVLVFGALFAAADAVFEDLVLRLVRVDLDVELIASHLVLVAVCGWLVTGYLRGFLTGTELTPLRGLWRDGARLTGVPERPTLGITEVATVLAVLDLLFLLFVVVQFRYLFGGDALVQVTPDLTYADYARRGFFELVFAVVLVVPLLLAADWLLARRKPGDDLVFRALAGAQIGLVLAITASALYRLRLYHASYGFTESRFYAMVLLVWIGLMLAWLAATVLRGRRDRFAFGALVGGLGTIALLFVVNPDAIVARTNVARLASADAAVDAVVDAAARFDVAYATSLSADAAPILIEALPALPADVQCPLARHLLRRWSSEREASLRTWSWSAARARDAVGRSEARLRGMAGPGEECAVPGAASVLDREPAAQS